MTQVNFTSYEAPGVFVEDQTTPIVSVVGSSGPAVIALVGPSVGYRMGSESIVISTTNTRLAQLGIDPTSITVSALDGTVYVPGDYNASAGAGADASLVTTHDNTLDLARTGGGNIPDGSQVFVTYRYTDTAYFEATPFGNFEDVKEVYGEPIDTDAGTIISPISLAAQIAFQNGARQIVCVASAGTATLVTRAQLATALSKLETIAVDIVVVLPVGVTGIPSSPGDVINVASDLRTHVEAMSTNGASDNLARIGIIGHETTATVLPNVIAQAINDKRVMLAWPNQMSYFNGLANQTMIVGGYYLAAAYAGIFASLPTQEGITRKTVRGFNGIPSAVLNTMSKPTKDAYSSAGVAVTERTRDGRLIVRHGTTTNPSSVNTREASLIRAQDALIADLIQAIESAQIIGSPINEETPARIKGLATGVLENEVTTNLIVNYSGVAVRQRSLDPTVIEVKFQYLPAFPLNYIVISFSINLTTGVTDLFAQTP